MVAETQTAVFGGGCFWCTEAVFETLKGVISVESGYAGGRVKNPSYVQVSSGNTGHAEVIKVTFNPREISFEELLQVFFAAHDPTTPNQQGNDIGEQYRSVIFYADESQKQAAARFIERLAKSGEYSRSIVTEIVPLDEFFTAEEYHQDFYGRNKEHPYCEIVIDPKLEKVRSKFAKLLK